MVVAARADDAPPTAASAASEIGRSVFVVNDVDGKAGDAPPQHIAVNDDILFGEDVTTGADAKTVLEFRDGSTFEIGPDAAVRVDSFVFNPEESTSHKAIDVTRGVFRYVSGYVASDQEATIATPHGQMGIRGSVAEGVVDPAVPDFVFLGEGSATFTNSAGSTTLQPGNSIAVPSATTAPMASTAMPPAVAAQALQAIEKRLPPRSALADRPPASEAWLKRTGAANLVPAAEQQRLSAPGRATTGAPARSGAIAGELGLLTEGNRVGLFAAHRGPPTPEQAAFLDRAAHENPTAASVLHRATVDARAIHGANVSAGTALVIRGIGHAAPSADVMHRVTAAAVHANPAAAALINRHASEAYRGPDHAIADHAAGPANQREPIREPAARELGGRTPATTAPNTNLPGSHQPPGSPANARSPEPQAPGRPPPGPGTPFVRPPNPYERQVHPPNYGVPPGAPLPPGYRAPPPGSQPPGFRPPQPPAPGFRPPQAPAVPGVRPQVPPVPPRNGAPPPKPQEKKPPPKKKQEDEQNQNQH
jgi:FecR-like protein